MGFFYFLRDSIKQDGWVACLVFSISLITIGFVIGILIHFVDRVGIIAEPQKVTVVGRNFTPSYVIINQTTVNGALISTPNIVPDTWIIEVEDKEKYVLTCEVTKAEYETIENGSKITGMIGNGRLTSYKYCTKLIPDI